MTDTPDVREAKGGLRIVLNYGSASSGFSGIEERPASNLILKECKHPTHIIGSPQAVGNMANLRTRAESSTHETSGDQLTKVFNETFARKAEDLIPTLYERTDLPLSVIEFEKDDYEFFNCKPKTIHTIAELPSLTYGKGSQLVLDFGSHRVGYLAFDLGVQGINIDAPARLRLTFGEVPYDVTESFYPYRGRLSVSWLPDEVINVDWLPTRVELSRRYSFRYVKIEVIDTSPKFKVRFQNLAVKAVSSIPPAVESGVEPLETKDVELNNLDRISQVTLRDCMHTVFEDGPRRDRRLWIGDLRLQAVTNYCTFKDFNLVKRCLYMFAAVARSDGSLPAGVFEKPNLKAASDYIVGYDALFGPTVHDYAVASGDLETAVELWPTILNSMKIALSHLDTNGKFNSDSSSHWKFLDWSNGLDTNAGMHGLVLYCCKEINKLATLISKPVPFKDIVKLMDTATILFYDPSLGIFVSGKNKQVSWISQAWLTLGGALDKPTCLRAIKNVMKDPKAIKPLTPYAFHHVAEALARCGGEDECLALMRRYWGGMVRAGADTFWESYDENDSRNSPYGDCHINSYCHAWSCTPSYLLRVVLKDYLAGMKEESRSEDD